MKHLGDITKINGAEIEPVDCITGGSPCQDLSVAGKRAGLAGERSGLFMEQIRIVKEMREHDRRIKRADDDFRLRPRYMVWENVPGAFSSNKGQDFQAVLTEIVRIVRPDAPDVPLPDRGGWSKSGCIMGYGATGCPFSIAWRLHDAQFWGVPQRRKRIALVADFGGFSAPEICFERNGLRGDSSESGAARKETAGTVKGGVDYPIGFNRERCGAVTAYDLMPTLQAAAGESGNNKPMVMTYSGENITSPTNKANPQPGDPCHTLDQDSRNYVVCLQGNGIDRADTAGCNGRGWCEDVSYTLNTIDRPAVYAAGFDGNMGVKAGQTMNTLCLNDQGGSVMNVTENISGTLRAQEHGHQPAVFEAYQHHGLRESETAGQKDHVRGDTPLVYGITAYSSNSMKSSNPYSGIYKTDTAKTLDLNCGFPGCNQGGIAVVQQAVYENHGQDCRYKQLENVSETISAKYGEGGNNQPLVLSIGNGQTDAACCSNADVAHTLNCMHDPLAVYISGTYQDKTGTFSPGGHPGSYNGQDAYNDMLITSVDCRNASEDPNINATLQANPKTVNNNNVCRIGSQVRRLTPLECERLQGFPDGWTDIGEWVDSKGKKHKESDSPRYKALGNSIAVGYANNGSGFWMWLLKRISAQYERNATLGSLFDGIGGFPLAWEHFNGKGSARWASEIEEFPIAVTKKHFPED